MPIRKTKTHADAVLWVGVEYPNGQWLILPRGRHPDHGMEKPDEHRCKLPEDRSRLETISPPPTPEEQSRLRAEPRTTEKRPSPQRPKIDLKDAGEDVYQAF
jgi:hypothetical protein